MDLVPLATQGAIKDAPTVTVPERRYRDCASMTKHYDKGDSEYFEYTRPMTDEERGLSFTVWKHAVLNPAMERAHREGLSYVEMEPPKPVRVYTSGVAEYQHSDLSFE